MSRRRNVFTALAAAVLAAAPATIWALVPGPEPATDPLAGYRADPGRFAEAGIVDVPVRFSVRNTNDSRVACNVDGAEYEIHGHLTLPTELLAQPDRPVTLYQHGIAAGEWYWRVDVPGYHHAEELARRGHASVTIDRLGYGASDKPDGMQLCVGGAADMTHQIVQQLRAGSYQVLGDLPDLPADADETVPRFDSVVLAGHSNGGQIAQIAAYSYPDIDGLILMGWTDLGLTEQANARFFTTLQTCLWGGSPVAEDGPAGYAYYDLGAEEFAAGNFHDTDQAVLTVSVPQQHRHPCGDMVSQLNAVFVDLQLLGEIEVPVLMLLGDQDARVAGGEQHRALFSGAETELIEIPAAGHYLGLDRNAPLVHDAQAAWLERHGL